MQEQESKKTRLQHTSLNPLYRRFPADQNEHVEKFAKNRSSRTYYPEQTICSELLQHSIEGSIAYFALVESEFFTWPLAGASFCS